MRPCGACRLCCKVFPLPVLDKPAGAWCRHAHGEGCAVHGPQMLEICRQYDCYWREHDALPEAWRPNRIGSVVTEAGSVTVGHRWLPVVLLQEDFAEDLSQDLTANQGSQPALGGSETTPEASRPAAPPELVDYFVGRGVAVMVIRGLEARIEFDRVRYPGVTADDIEAALRYELSQDAEELKRLGAVGDDYRPLSRDEAKAACRNPVPGTVALPADEP